MLIGVPLGLSSGAAARAPALSSQSPWSSSTTSSLHRQWRSPVKARSRSFAGVWSANFFRLLRHCCCCGRWRPEAELAAYFASLLQVEEHQAADANEELSPQQRARAASTRARAGFRSSSTTMSCANFSPPLPGAGQLCLLMLVFTFFELLGDIIRNRTPLVTVGEYLINLTPSMIYTITPLSVLIAVLVTFGVLNRTNEFTAMKATGISLYRVVVPILVIAAFLLSRSSRSIESYLPGANRRQEALRSVIKGRPAQTFLRPDQKWIFGTSSRASRAGSSTTSSSIPTMTASPTSPSSSSTRRTSPSPGESSPPAPTGNRRLHQWIFEHGWERLSRRSGQRAISPSM